MFNQSHTILLITRQVLARIDLRGRRRLSVKQIWTEPSSDYDALLPEVSRALKLTTARPGRVTVVCPDFWTGLLSLPNDVTSIASENEINQALALEAEVDSGLSAFDSRTNSLRIAGGTDRGEDGHWCVTQVPSAQIRELSLTLRNLGARLHSVAHPVAARYLSSEPESLESVQELLDSWSSQQIFNAAKLQDFATLWSSCLSQHPSHPLLILAESDSTHKSQPVALTASLALVAAGGCGLWHWKTQQCLTMTTHSIEQLEKSQSKNEANEAALKSAEASVAQLRQEIAKARNVRFVAERQLQLADATHSQHNRRWLALVDALAASAAENCWVKKLESTSVQTVVHGLALDNAAANGFAGRLELALNGSGWRAEPAATSVTADNLIQFKIVLKAILKPEVAFERSKLSLVGPSTAVDTLARGTAP